MSEQFLLAVLTLLGGLISLILTAMVPWAYKVHGRISVIEHELITQRSLMEQRVSTLEQQSMQTKDSINEVRRNVEVILVKVDMICKEQPTTGSSQD